MSRNKHIYDSKSKNYIWSQPGDVLSSKNIVAHKKKKKPH